MSQGKKNLHESTHSLVKLGESTWIYTRFHNFHNFIIFIECTFEFIEAQMLEFKDEFCWRTSDASMRIPVYPQGILKLYFRERPLKVLRKSHKFWTFSVLNLNRVWSHSALASHFKFDQDRVLTVIRTLFRCFLCLIIRVMRGSEYFAVCRQREIYQHWLRL